MYYSAMWLWVVCNSELLHFPGVNFMDRKGTSPTQNIHFLNKVGLKVSEIALSNPEVKKLITTDEKFDLILTEGFLSDSVYSGFSWAHKAPVIAFGTLMPVFWLRYMVRNEHSTLSVNVSNNF